jgi:hypothetical protein
LARGGGSRSPAPTSCADARDSPPAHAPVVGLLVLSLVNDVVGVVVVVLPSDSRNTSSKNDNGPAITSRHSCMSGQSAEGAYRYRPAVGAALRKRRDRPFPIGYTKTVMFLGVDFILDRENLARNRAC